MDQVKKLRNHGKNSDLALVEGAQQFRGVQSFQIDHARALHQRQQEIRHLRKHVKEREHAEHGIFGADPRPAEHRFNFAHEIGVSQHHALGIGSRAGGIEQGSHMIRGN